MGTPAERFEADLYTATLEIGGLTNAKLRELGVAPDAAITASERIRRDLSGAVKLMVYFDALRTLPLRKTNGEDAAATPPTNLT